VTDPHSGQTKIKKKLGGAYPGQRRPNHGQFTPDATQFDSNGQAVVHFKAYGGGNALTLVQQDGSNRPVTGAVTPEYIEGSFATGPTASILLLLYSFSQWNSSLLPNSSLSTVTLPDGVFEGQTIHVQAPDGRLNAIVVPPGFGPGSKFTVEFAPEETAVPAPSAPVAPVPATKADYGGTSYNNAPVAPVAPPPPGGDDGFASGFGNPHYKPPVAQATTSFSDQYYQQYPSTQATPVYGK
jgi:hypothetical protein